MEATRIELIMKFIILLAFIASAPFTLTKEVPDAGNEKSTKATGIELSDLETNVKVPHVSLRGLRHEQRAHSRNGTSDCKPVRIDFSSAGDGTLLQHGDYVKDDWYEAFGMTIEAAATKRGYTPSGKARIFDTSFVPSEDPDLNSPNENCPTPGPGVGAAGGQGKPGENCNPEGEGNVLIIQESKKIAPNDNAYGGSFTFTFDRPKEGIKIGLMDIDAVEESYFTIFTTDGSSIKQDISGLGDNSIQEETIVMEDVRRISLTVSNSAGVRYVEFCGDDVAAPPSSPSPSPTLSASPLPAGPFVYFRSAAWDDASNPCSHPDECRTKIAIEDTHWVTHRFKVHESTGLVVTSVGGAFVTADIEVTMFAAISRLESATDYPDYKRWRLPNSIQDKDVVAVQTFTIPSNTHPRTTGETEIPLTAKLEPGWYALTFGTNLLGVEPLSDYFLSMVLLAFDLEEEQTYFNFHPSRNYIVDSGHRNEGLFVVKGVFPVDGCYMSMDLVDDGGNSAQGWLAPNLIGLDWFYRSNGSYEMSFVAYISGDCPEIGSVRLELKGQDGNTDHSQCERVPPYALFGDDTEGSLSTFTPAFGDKTIVATTFTGTSCQSDTTVNTHLLNVEFWWTTFWTTPSSWEASDVLQIILVRTENRAELCELSRHFTINVAKLPSDLAIEARFKHDFDPKSPDRKLGLKFELDEKDSPIQESQPYAVDISNVARTDTATGGYPPLPPHLLEVSIIETKGGTEFFRGKYSFFVVHDTSLSTPFCSSEN